MSDSRPKTPKFSDSMRGTVRSSALRAFWVAAGILAVFTVVTIAAVAHVYRNAEARHRRHYAQIAEMLGDAALSHGLTPRNAPLTQRVIDQLQLRDPRIRGIDIIGRSPGGMLRYIASTDEARLGQALEGEEAADLRRREATVREVEGARGPTLEVVHPFQDSVGPGYGVVRIRVHDAPEVPLTEVWAFAGLGVLLMLLALGNFAWLQHRTLREFEAQQRLLRETDQRRRTAEGLRQSEMRFRTIFENTPDGAMLFDRDGHVLEFNPAHRRVFGLSEDERLHDYNLFDDPHASPNIQSVLAETGRAQVCVVYDFDRARAENLFRTERRGRLRLEVHVQAIGHIPGRPTEHFLMLTRDVTARYEAEEARRRSEEMFRSVFENAHDGINICEIDPGTRGRKLVMCNDRFVEMSGRSRQELLGADDINAFIERDDSTAVVEYQRKAIVTGVPFRGISKWLRPDGGELVYEWTAVTIQRDGRYLAVGIDRDITERLRAEEERRQSVEMLKLLVDHAHDGVNICEYDPQTHARRLIMCNDRYVEISGYPREELMACENLNDIAHELPRPDSEMSSHRCLVEGIPFRGRGRWDRPDQRENTYEFTAVSVPYGERFLVIGIDRDITERLEAEAREREMEIQMQHTQKLESLGVLAGGIAHDFNNLLLGMLAGGIAHDFNNLLLGMLGNANLALMDLPSGSPVRGAVQEIETAARRAADLCRQMLAYSGRGQFVIEEVDLNALLREMTELLEVSISKRATLRFDLDADLPCIEADSTQMRQVVMNLITNASDALGDQDGVITLRTSVRDCSARYLAESYLSDDLEPGRYVHLEVADTGCGMDRETVDRIFDPFFTTKFTGRGLGLAAVLGIVRGHQGALRVYSEIGHGSLFRILLPVRVAQADSEPEKPAMPGAETQDPCDWRGEGTVLLVDDEEAVRQVASQMLERMGLSVLLARDGREAVDLVEQHGRTIDLVLLDLTMPHMDGQQALGCIREIRADLPVLLSSGYTEQEVVGRMAEAEMAGFVQKPYDLNELSKAISRILTNGS